MAKNDYSAALSKENDKTLKQEYDECLSVEKSFTEAKNAMADKRISEALSYINHILKCVPDWREAKILQIECLAKMGLAERVRNNIFE